MYIDIDIDSAGLVFTVIVNYLIGDLPIYGKQQFQLLKHIFVFEFNNCYSPLYRKY